MTPSDRQRFEELFKRVMGVQDCHPDDSMANLYPWDSLKHVELLIEIDEAFGGEIDPTQVWRMTDVAGILAVLDERGGGGER
jgi:acyl carrier protein